MTSGPQDHPAFEVSVVEQTGDLTTLAFAGELDVSVADRVRGALDDVLDGGARHLLLDMAEVRFLDSRTIGVLIGVMKRAKALGGSLVLRRPQPHVLKSLMILGLGPSFGLDSGP